MTAVLAVAAGAAGAADLTLTPSAVGFHNPIGIDWQETTGTLILSSNYPNGAGNNLDRAQTSGAVAPFSTLSGLTEELKVATVRQSDCQSRTGFQVGDVFTGNGNMGQVVRVSADGNTVVNPWVMLPSEQALLRGSLFHDRFGVAGCDLVVVTGNELNGNPAHDNLGNVWRVSLGVNGTPSPMKIATLGRHLEGVTTLPDDPVRFGPAAGRILAGAEDYANATGGLLIAVNPNAVDDFFTIGGPGSSGIGGHQHYTTNIAVQPEDLDIIRANSDLYGIAFQANTIYTVSAADFAGRCGQLLITQEYPGATSGFFAMRWDAVANGGTGAFVIDTLTANMNVAQWEHVTFSGGSDCAPAGSRMTGGGSIFTGTGNATRVTHGFELRCDAADKRQNLEINWPGAGKSSNNFHLDSLTKVTCLDDPAIGPRPPNAGFDTYIGEGLGTCNGKPATIKFTFTDAGEPGTYDSAEYQILGGCTLDAAKSRLTKGNHQAHKG